MCFTSLDGYKMQSNETSIHKNAIHMILWVNKLYGYMAGEYKMDELICLSQLNSSRNTDLYRVGTPRSVNNCSIIFLSLACQILEQSG